LGSAGTCCVGPSLELVLFGDRSVEALDIFLRTFDQSFEPFFFGLVWFGVLRVLFSAKVLLFCAEDRAQGCNFVGEAMMMRRARN